MNRTITSTRLRAALLGTSVLLLPATAAVAAPSNPQYWNGTTVVADGSVHGGAGTWNAANTNWTDPTGVNADAWASLGAYFQGTGTAAPGAVTVGSAVSTTGMTFTGAGAGWSLTGSNITLVPTSGSTTITVGDGSGASSTYTATIGNVLAGTGVKMIKSGAGTLVLTATSSYTGGTQVDAGTLQIGAGSTTGTISATGGLLINGAGTVVFNRSNTLSLASVITGTGAIKQLGAGTLTLSGNSSAFAGTTTVGNGVAASALTVSGNLGGTTTVTNLSTLTVSGTVASAVVQNGALLTGTGNVTAATLSSGSQVQGTLNLGTMTFGSGVTVSPGVGASGVIGTLRGAAGGTLTFNAGSTFAVDVTNTGTKDWLNSAGAVSINGGTLQVNAGSLPITSWNNETVYTIITATGGIAHSATGFTTVTSNLAFLLPTVTYNTNTVDLTLTRNDINYAAVGRTDNQSATGAALQSLGSGALYHSILVASVPTAQSAFDQLSGEIHASLRGVMVDDSRMPRTAILSRLADDDDRGVWIEGFDNWGSTDIDDNAAATRHDTKGFLAGADMHVVDNIRVGFAAGWSHTKFEADARNSDAVLNTVHVLGYAGATFDALRLNAGLGYAHSNIQTERTVSYTGYSDMLEGNYDGSILQAFGEAAYAVPFRSFTFSPFANVAVVDAHTADFTEQGGLAALSGENKSETSTFSTLGLRFQTPQDAEFSVTANAGWRHTFGTATPFSTLSFNGSTPFVVAGMASDRDAAATDLGVAWRIWPGLTASAAYNGILSASSHDDAVRVKVTQDF